jgi:hypothetical protein
MSDDERARFDAAVRDVWAALSEMPQPDRLILVGVFVVGLIIGFTEDLRAWTPFYALVLTALVVALWWAIRQLARTKRDE